jgi:hypothetical protein
MSIKHARMPAEERVCIVVAIRSKSMKRSLSSVCD